MHCYVFVNKIKATQKKAFFPLLLKNIKSYINLSNGHNENVKYFKKKVHNVPKINAKDLGNIAASMSG